MKKFILGITGASGAVLAANFIKKLVQLNFQKELHIILSENGLRTFEFELGAPFQSFYNTLNNPNVILYTNSDMFAKVASGSFHVDGMFVLPCSMSTLGKVAHGIGDSLICRAAGVCLKERVKLVISPREMPLSQIYLQNMLALTQAGAVIAPPIPTFYAININCKKPYETLLNEMTGRILKAGGIENNLYTEWGGSCVG